MRVLVVVVLVAGLFGAYRWWDGRSADAAEAVSQNGFVPVQMPDGAPGHTVLVLAPPDCPSAEAQRAEALILDLARQGIPVTRGSTMSFNLVDPTAEQRRGVERAVAVFNRGAPAVFIDGMAMSNPTAAQAAAEYRKAKTRGPS